MNQLLHLMVPLSYGIKEIFLRELVTNASDAGDKLCFEGLADPAFFESDPDLKIRKIRVAYDKAAQTITVSAKGIGCRGRKSRSRSPQSIEVRTG